MPSHPHDGFRQIGTRRINNQDHAVFARVWNPYQLTQEDFIMPTINEDPITSEEEIISRLRLLAQTQEQTISRFRRNFTNLINELYKAEDDDVDSALINAGVPEPRRRYRFTYRVQGTMTREFTGATDEEAWDNGDANSFHHSDVEDLEYDFGGYTDVEMVGIEAFSPSELNDFLNRS
jgi:hypothetical protein